MPVTGLRGRQILDGDVFRNDLNTTTSGSAVITKIIAGTNITISSTGVDAGTGDVTINATASGGGATWTKESVRAATTANITLSGTQTIDGVVLGIGNRVLVKNQTTTSQNGIYVVASGSWTRATDSDTALEVASSLVAVLEGTTNGGTTWDNDFKSTDTLGTTALMWYRVFDSGATIGVANGGSGATTLTGVLIGNGTSAFTGVTGTASQLLRRNAGNSAYEFFTGGNLTRTDDTNVTLTLGGTPTGALINAVSLTLGWSGQLSVARGGTGASTLTGVLVGNGTGAVTAVSGTASQLLRRNAGNTAYEFFTHTFASTGTGTTNTIAKYTNANTIGNSTITDTGTVVTILGTTAFMQSGSLPSATGGTFVIVDDYASPVAGRIFFGDGTGWSMHFSKRNASTTSDIITITDAGHLQIVSGKLITGTSTSTNGSILLQDNYSAGNLTNIGTSFSSGGIVLGYSVYPSNAAQYSFLSATSLTSFPRGALVIEDTLRWFTGGAQTVAIGTAASLVKRFEILGTGQMALGAYTSSTSFSGTVAGYLAFDSSGNIITSAGTGGGGGGISGSGTTNYIPKFTASTTVGDSTIFDNGSNVGIGTATPLNITNYRTLHIQGGTGGGVVNFSTSDGTSRGYIYGSSAETAINCPTQFRVYAGATSQIFATASGVGIGAASNGYNLFVQGTGATLTEFSSTSANGGYISFTRSSTTYFAYIGNSFHLFGAGFNANTDLGIRSEGSINFGTGATATMRLASTGQLRLVNYTSLSSFTGVAVGYLGFDSNGAVFPLDAPIPYNVGSICFSAEVPNTWSNQPSTLQFFDSSSAYVTQADLSAYNQVRLVVNKQTQAGATGSKLILRYQATSGAPLTASSYSDIGITEVSVATNVTNTILNTGWIDMAAGAIDDVYIALLGSGGDGALDPVYGNIYAEFRYFPSINQN